jgi:hypothetical protein
MAWVMKNIKNYSNKCKCILQIKYKNVWVDVWESQDALGTDHLIFMVGGGGGGGGKAPFWKCPIFFCPHRLRTIFFPNFCSILVLQTCRTRFFYQFGACPMFFRICALRPSKIKWSVPYTISKLDNCKRNCQIWY